MNARVRRIGKRKYEFTTRK